MKKTARALALTVIISCCASQTIVPSSGGMDGEKPETAETAGMMSLDETARDGARHLDDRMPVENLETAEMMSLGEAARDFARYLDGRIQKDSPSAVLSVEAPLKGIADYVADTLTAELLNTTGARMVSRQSLETVIREQDIQADGFVDEDTAARLGYIAGWKTVVTGAVTALSAGYRLNLRAMDVESAELLGAKNYVIKSDATLAGIVNPSQTVRELSRREELLRPFTEQQNAFDLTARPAGGKDVFYDGDEMFISLKAGADCYFVVYQMDVEVRMQMLFPNAYDTDNTLKAGVERMLPEYSRLDLHAPFGEEQILVYASEKPIAISPEQYAPKQLDSAYMANPAAPWQAGTAPQDGGKGVSIRPRGAAGRFSYTIAPR